MSTTMIYKEIGTVGHSEWGVSGETAKRALGRTNDHADERRRPRVSLHVEALARPRRSLSMLLTLILEVANDRAGRRSSLRRPWTRGRA